MTITTNHAVNYRINKVIFNMSEPAGGNSPALGGISAAAPSPTAVNVESGQNAATSFSSDSASPILQHPNQDIANEVPAPMETTTPINNSTDDAVENKETEAEEAAVASASTFNVLQPHDEADNAPAPLAAAATAANATTNDNIAPAANNENSSNEAAAPTIAKSALGVNTNSDAATAGDSSRNPSPMNILADVASMEKVSGEDQDNKKADNIQKDNVSGTIAIEALLSSDIILSLKENTYKTIMYQYFRKLEDNANSGLKDNEEENKARDEVLELLKDDGGRLLDPVHFDEPSLGFIELDEETARQSEYKI